MSLKNVKWGLHLLQIQIHGRESSYFFLSFSGQNISQEKAGETISEEAAGEEARDWASSMSTLDTIARSPHTANEGFS